MSFDMEQIKQRWTWVQENSDQCQRDPGQVSLSGYMAACIESSRDVPALIAEVERLRDEMPECNGLCLRASDLIEVSDNRVARPHRGCRLHGDPDVVAGELEAEVERLRAENAEHRRTIRGWQAARDADLDEPTPEQIADAERILADFNAEYGLSLRLAESSRGA